jgi:hypothetical protein
MLGYTLCKRIFRPTLLNENVLTWRNKKRSILLVNNHLELLLFGFCIIFPVRFRNFTYECTLPSECLGIKPDRLTERLCSAVMDEWNSK